MSDPDTSIILGSNRRTWLIEHGGISFNIHRLIDRAILGEHAVYPVYPMDTHDLPAQVLAAAEKMKQAFREFLQIKDDHKRALLYETRFFVALDEYRKVYHDWMRVKEIEDG